MRTVCTHGSAGGDAMIDDDMNHLSADVREGLAHAQARARKASGGRLRVQVGDVWYPVLSYDAGGFEVALDIAPKLRGLVEIHEGPRFLRSVLIVATEPSGDRMRYAFKRTTEARTTAPLDYERSGSVPSGYIGAD